MGACLLATLCYGIAASFTKRYLTGVHPLATATGSQIGAALGLALPTLLALARRAGEHWVPGARWRRWRCCAPRIAYILFFRIIAKAGPSKALTVTFLVPVFALLYGACSSARPSRPGW